MTAPEWLTNGDTVHSVASHAVMNGELSTAADFLRFSIATMRPALVATIGGDARRFVARLSTDLKA